MKVAESSDCSHRHGAVVVKSGRVLSVGTNRFRNDPEFVESDVIDGRGTIFSVHAEVNALSRVKDARGATIYVARVGGNGEPRLSAPCSFCRIRIKDRGINTIVYT
jgi:deoxycytidylate deaminase